uniref:Uncharacterized protein n=1 Tax=Cacopsylla melanoneura TaxID=428564 RepID=A0A8D8Z3F6_9HEMI
MFLIGIHLCFQIFQLLSSMYQWCIQSYGVLILLNIVIEDFKPKVISMLLTNQRYVCTQDFILTSQMYHSHRNDTDHCSRTDNERNKTVVDLKHVDQFISPRLGFVHEWDSCIVRVTSLWVFGSVDIASNIKFIFCYGND